MIPTYNCASFLRHTLESVLVQDPGPARMQVEVVDDGSSDDPRAVVDEVGRGRVEFHQQDRNVGHIRNFTTCIERARGELVHLLHGDDVVLPGFYAALDSGFTSPRVGAAFCRWKLIDEEGRTTWVASAAQDVAGPLSDAVVHLAEEQRIVTPSIVVRRSVYEELGGFDDRLVCSEDWEMWVRIAARFDVWYEPETLAAYRIRAESNTGRNERGAKELHYTALAIELFREQLPPDRARSIVRRARGAYAATALRTAKTYAAAHERSAARAHLLLAMRLSPTLSTFLAAAKAAPRVLGR
jgi:glycosyltransferase involved in cell wall biosynthesis